MNMPSITSLEMRALERVLGMSGGYVLDCCPCVVLVLFVVRGPLALVVVAARPSKRDEENQQPHVGLSD